ncbi:MAG: glycosyltransferase family 2 protein [Hyphomicrobiaceae bacterium]
MTLQIALPIRQRTPSTAALRPTAFPAPELAVVVPTFCEAENVSLLLAALSPALAGISYEVIFVDDDSPDGTVEVARKLAHEDPRIRAIRRIGRRGLAGAVSEGVLSTSAPYVAVMDCDLQHDEALLSCMLQALKSGADVAVATRYEAGGSTAGGFNSLRLWGSKAATWLSKLVLKTEISDPMSGFFMLRRDLFEEVAPKLSNGGFKILLDILASTPRSLRITEIPYTFRPRLAGDSKLNELVVADFAALVVSKATRDTVSPRFLMFALVGASGLGVHVLALKALLSAAHLPFDYAQLGASYVAMSSNFLLNNVLTYADRRLRGLQALKGFLSFIVVCSVGTLANVGVAKLIYAQDPDWLLAGVAGALMAAVFNYAMTSVVTWRAVRA